MIQIPYLAIFFILFLLSFPSTISAGKIKLRNNINAFNFQNSYYAILMIYIIIFFIGGRWYVGSDCINYENAFLDAPQIFGLTTKELELFFKKCGMEKGFCFFMILFKSFFNNYWVFSFFNSAFDYIIFYLCLRDYLPKYKGIAILIFYVFIADSHLGINMVRNLKSVMIFLYSIRYIVNKKFYKYILLNLFGCLFHLSSLFYLPLYFLLNKKISKSLFVIVYVAGLIVFFLNIKWVGTVLQPLANTNFGRISHLVLVYTDKVNPLSVSGRITIGFLERFFSFILLLKYKKIIEEKFKFGVIFVNMAFIYFIIFFFFNEIYIFVQRLPPLFLISYCFIFPMIYSLLTKEQKCYFYIIIFLYGFLRVYKGNSNAHYIYNNIFNPFKPDSFYRIKEIISTEYKVI